MIHSEGEEFDSPDGCMSWVCESEERVLVRNDREAEGDVDLASQEDVDLRTCLASVGGTLTISGAVTDLTPLAELWDVGGLEIIASDVVSLTGLNGIREVGGPITIAENERLTTLAFFKHMSVFGDVTIQNNDALVSLSGAEFVGNCTTCAAISGTPDDLVSHDHDAGPYVPRGAPGDGDVDVDSGGGESPGGTFFGKIIIADNDVLTNIGAFSNLYSAWDDVRFRNNAALTDLFSMTRLGLVLGDLEITGHAAMTSADANAFAAVVDTSGVVTICGNLDGPAC